MEMPMLYADRPAAPSRPASLLARPIVHTKFDMLVYFRVERSMNQQMRRATAFPQAMSYSAMRPQMLAMSIDDPKAADC